MHELPPGWLLVGPRESARLASALQLLLRLTESRRDGVRVPRDVMAMAAQLGRVAAVAGVEGLTSTDAVVSASVPASADRSWSVHEELLDTSQAAELLGCSRANVADLARRGSLEGVRRGRCWWFERDVVLTRRGATGRMADGTETT